MPYCTVEDLKTRIDEQALIHLTDTANLGVVDIAKTAAAIRDADALIDSYLGRVYAVPLLPIPMSVTDISASLAIFSLHRFRSVESPVWKAASDDAMTRLRAIARGEATLEGMFTEPPAAADESATLTFNASPRRFSRDLLKGM